MNKRIFIYVLSYSQVASTFLTSLRNDERANHQLDVKFQESYLKQVVALLRCRLSEGAVGSKDGEESDAEPENKEEKLPEEVEEGELPDTQGEQLLRLLSCTKSVERSPWLLSPENPSVCTSGVYRQQSHLAVSSLQCPVT